MSIESMADFICEMRKAKNLTQKQLAEQLNITDKAVSKWERGTGYPDITVLARLAEILGITTNELLNGRKDEAAQVSEQPVKNALQYAEKITKTYSHKAKNIVRAIIDISFVIAVFVCMVCDLAISRSLTWSLYPLSSIVFTWLIIEPFFFFQKGSKIKMSLVSISIFIIPYLFCIEQISHTTGWLLPLGAPIALISIAGTWLVFFLYKKMRNKWFASSIAMFVLLSISMAVNFICAKFTNVAFYDIFDTMSIILVCTIALILFIFGCSFAKK